MASEVFYPFEGAEVHTCINIERTMYTVDIQRETRNQSTYMHNSNPNPGFSKILRTPQPRLEITVQSFLRTRALEIAFEILACVNSHIQM